VIVQCLLCSGSRVFSGALDAMNGNRGGVPYRGNDSGCVDSRIQMNPNGIASDGDTSMPDVELKVCSTGFGSEPVVPCFPQQVGRNGFQGQ
jgi:hypothetical protein